MEELLDSPDLGSGIRKDVQVGILSWVLNLTEIMIKIYDPKTNTLDWKLLDQIPEIVALKNTPQNQKYHKEGNAFIHTCLVTQNMLDCIELGHPFIKKQHMFEDDDFKEMLVLSALLHDIGKSTVTKLGEDGLYHCRNHAEEGIRIADPMLREYFKDDKMKDFKVLAICNMIRYHMRPLYIFNKANPANRILSLANDLKYVLMDALLLLKYCDCKGSLTDEDTRWYETLQKVRELYYNTVTYKAGEEVTIEKISDNTTCEYESGNHPNGINVGYRRSGKLQYPVTVGTRCTIGFPFSSSPVTKIIDKCTFETKNSVYKIFKPEK